MRDNIEDMVTRIVQCSASANLAPSRRLTSTRNETRFGPRLLH